MSLQWIPSMLMALTTTIKATEIIENANFACFKNGKLFAETGNKRSCSAKSYNSARLFQLFGIDCCNEVAKESMDKFFSISQSMQKSSLLKDNSPVSYTTKTMHAYIHMIIFVIAALDNLHSTEFR